jgi:hypothetical protein
LKTNPLYITETGTESRQSVFYFTVGAIACIIFALLLLGNSIRNDRRADALQRQIDWCIANQMEHMVNGDAVVCYRLRPYKGHAR